MGLSITIPLAPATKKNSQRILRNCRTGKPFIAPSGVYEDYARDAKMYMRLRTDKPINTGVNVKCLFYMPTRRRVDLVNLLEAIDDILVDAGILEDDNSRIICAHDGSRVRYDKEKPRTEIEITEMGDT